MVVSVNVKIKYSLRLITKRNYYQTNTNVTPLLRHRPRRLFNFTLGTPVQLLKFLYKSTHYSGRHIEVDVFLHPVCRPVIVCTCIGETTLNESADKPHDYLCGRSVTFISDEAVILSAAESPADQPFYQNERARLVLWIGDRIKPSKRDKINAYTRVNLTAASSAPQSPLVTLSLPSSARLRSSYLLPSTQR